MASGEKSLVLSIACAVTENYGSLYERLVVASVEVEVALLIAIEVDTKGWADSCVSLSAITDGEDVCDPDDVAHVEVDGCGPWSAAVTVDALYHAWFGIVSDDEVY